MPARYIKSLGTPVKGYGHREHRSKKGRTYRGDRPIILAFRQKQFELIDEETGKELQRVQFKTR